MDPEFVDYEMVAIDPATGNSALHRAAAVGNVNFLKAVLKSFGP